MTTASLTGARGITLHTPWAHAVAWHGKDIENRTWMPHEGVDVLLVHAGKSADPAGRAALDALGLDHTAAVTSAVVAVADLAYACNTARWQPSDCGCGTWALPGHCHWRLVNVRPLADPVPATGKQGLWKPATSLIEAVAEQLADAGDTIPTAPTLRTGRALSILDYRLLQAVASGSVYRTETGHDMRSGGNAAFRASPAALVDHGLVQLVGGTYELTDPAGRAALDRWLAAGPGR